MLIITEVSGGSRSHRRAEGPEELCHQPEDQNDQFQWFPALLSKGRQSKAVGHLQKHNVCGSSRSQLSIFFGRPGLSPLLRLAAMPQSRAPTRECITKPPERQVHTTCSQCFCKIESLEKRSTLRIVCRPGLANREKNPKYSVCPE